MKKLMMITALLAVLPLTSYAKNIWEEYDQDAAADLKTEVLGRWAEFAKVAKSRGIQIMKDGLTCVATSAEDEGNIGSCTWHGVDDSGYAIDTYYVLNVLPTTKIRGEPKWDLHGPYVIHED